MILTENSLIISFDDKDRYLYMSKILSYLEHTKLPHYYLFFLYNEGNIDMSEYRKKYPELLKDYGFIKLMKEMVKDHKFIIDLLYEYQSATLILTDQPDLDKKNSFDSMRKRRYKETFGGYTIFVHEGGNPLLKKEVYMPSWDTDLLEIPLNDIHAEQENKKWNFWRR